ncbi:MAG TPA: hypothetical protein PLU83_11245 [Phycicoccus sp.]|nr:hypothetical protein [Phycicoccus sp.]
MAAAQELLDLSAMTSNMPTADLLIAVDAWLAEQTAPEPGLPIVWRPRGRPGPAVRNAEHLAVLVSLIPGPGEWAVIEWRGHPGKGWCQTMRYAGGWVVEVHDGTPEDWAQRVYRTEQFYPEPAGVRPPFTHELWSPVAAADIMWAWLHGSLLEGCARTDRHLINPHHDHGLG